MWGIFLGGGHAESGKTEAYKASYGAAIARPGLKVLQLDIYWN